LAPFKRRGSGVTLPFNLVLNVLMELSCALALVALPLTIARGMPVSRSGLENESSIAQPLSTLAAARTSSSVKT